MWYTQKENRKGHYLDGLRPKQITSKLMEFEHDSVQPNTSFVSNQTSETDNDFDKMTESVLTGMAPAIFLGQCFSVLGVANAACTRGRTPIFRWLSLRTFYSVVVSSLFAMHAILIAIYNIPRNGMKLNAGPTLLFSIYISCFVMSCMFIRLAIHWPSFCTAFDNLEKRVSFYGRNNGSKRRMKIVTAAVFISSLAERILVEIRYVSKIDNTQSMSAQSIRDWLQLYYNSKFAYMAVHIPFSPLCVVGAFLVNFYSALINPLNDLFLILISMAVSSQFGILNNSLRATAHQEKDAKFWRRSRETYNALCIFVRKVDRCFSWHVLLSFLNNLFFISLQMLHTVRWDGTTPHENIHRVFAYGVMLVRAVTVGIYAASVGEESRAIGHVLFLVPSKSYCLEVKRFIQQVSSDEVALTGCNFFTVTRSFLLAVLGTIATYEVMLLQSS